MSIESGPSHQVESTEGEKMEIVDQLIQGIENGKGQMARYDYRTSKGLNVGLRDVYNELMEAYDGTIDGHSVFCQHFPPLAGGREKAWFASDVRGIPEYALSVDGKAMGDRTGSTHQASVRVEGKVSQEDIKKLFETVKASVEPQQ